MPIRVDTAPSDPQPACASILSFGAAIVAGWIGIVGSLFTGTLPAITAAFQSSDRVSLSQAGYIVGVDLFGQVLGTLIFLAFNRKIGWRVAAAMGLLLMAAGNAFSSLSLSITMLESVRLIAGLGVGIARAAAFAALTLAALPARANAFFSVAQTLSLMGAFAVYPLLTTCLGWSGPMIGLSVLSVASIPLAFFGPRSANVRRPVTNSKSAPLSWLALAAVLVYFVGQSAIWAFIVPLGNTVSGASDIIAKMLAFAVMPGLAGSLLALRLDKALTVGSALIFAVALTIAALVLMITASVALLFVAAIGLFYFAWSLSVPFQFAVVARTTHGERASAAFPAADGLGLAAGPVVGGVLMGLSGPTSLVVLSAICSALGTLTLVWIHRQRG